MLALAAGTDLKVVQDQLGHSTIALAAETYASVLPETARAAAYSTAALLFPPAGTGAHGQEGTWAGGQETCSRRRAASSQALHEKQAVTLQQPRVGTAWGVLAQLREGPGQAGRC